MTGVIDIASDSEFIFRSNMEMVGKRLPYHAQYTLKSDKTGLLQDVNIKLFCDCGCNTNESTGPDAATFTQNCYNAKWNVVPEAVTTDTAANTFCRFDLFLVLK